MVDTVLGAVRPLKEPRVGTIASSRPPLASHGGAWQPSIMARETTDEAWVQLATRIPKPLHRELKLHCVHTDTSLMAFVVAALKEKLVRERRRAGPSLNRSGR